MDGRAWKGYSPWGLKEPDTNEQLTLSFHNTLSLLCRQIRFFNQNTHCSFSFWEMMKNLPVSVASVTNDHKLDILTIKVHFSMIC